LPEAIALIEKYHSEERDTLFPLLHWSNLRRHMKALAALVGIKDDLCYHCLRHIVFSFSLRFNSLQNISA